MAKSTNQKAKLIIRNAIIKDMNSIRTLTTKVYPHATPYTADMIRGQIQNFPRGQFVAVYEGKIVGYCATFMIDGEIALQAHTWHEITGGGFGSRHDTAGDYLYGMEVMVDPDYRGMRIGQRLYDVRKKLCRENRLKGIVFGGRLPGLAKAFRNVGSVEKYIELVQQRKKRDQVLSFQLRNGFEVLGVLPDYLTSDRESLGYGAHLLWKNPDVRQDEGKTNGHLGRIEGSVRIAAVQYGLRAVTSFEEFCQYVEYFVDVVADYKADFVTFPELFTMQLLSLNPEIKTPRKSIEKLTTYTDDFRSFMNDLAVKYNINIIGGSHPTRDEKGDIYNVAYAFLRDGSIHTQAKIHPTPNEKFWWDIRGGNRVESIMTDCGPIGIMVCYDSEFPEQARHLINQGAQILFVPFCTDERKSYMRVRYCSQARAVENQCYVVMAGNVGNLPGVANMDIQYAESCILTPCDFPFARDGVAADTTPNVEMVAFADLRLQDLIVARNSGTVQNLHDRRFDLYSVQWIER